MTALQPCLLRQFFIHPNGQKFLLCVTLSFAHAVHLIRVIYCLPIVIFMCVPFCYTRGQTLEGRNCPISHLVSPTLVPEINKCVDVDGKKAIALAHRRVWRAGLVLTPAACFQDKVMGPMFNLSFSTNNVLKGNSVPTQGPGMFVFSLKEIFTNSLFYQL